MSGRTLAAALSRRSFLSGAAAIGITLPVAGRLAFAAEEPQVNVYNWDTYIGPTTLDDFTDATDIEVRYDLYADNAELFARLREGNPGYDVVVPTNDYVERMIAANLVQLLDHSLIPNFANLDPQFQDAIFDPGRKFSLPYMWGTIGIGYRKSKVDEVPNSWGWLFDSDRYSGRIATLSEPVTVIGMAMKYLGYSLNSGDAAQIQAAVDLLIKQKPHIKAFAPDNGQDLLLSGEVDLVMEWNGDMLQVMAEDDDVSYILPREGGLLWQDCLCIPAGAPHPQNAHAFINYLQDAEANAAIADFIQYATPNAAAKAFLPGEYLNNPAIFPPAPDVAKSEAQLFLGQEITQLYDESWTRLEAA